MDPEEVLRLAYQVGRGVVDVDSAAALCTDTELKTLLAVAHWVATYQDRTRSKSQQRARRLLRSLLSQDQKDELRRRKSFTVTGSAGGRYRLEPSVGLVSSVERHGRRDFVTERICFHEAPEAEALPGADRTIAQMLIITTDEAAFREQIVGHVLLAGRHNCGMWDGQWRRRLNRARAVPAEP